MKVTKRDGSFENYSVSTVKRAIREAFKSSKLKYNKDVISNIANAITVYDNIPVEEIQDQIETSLYQHDFPIVAKEFILYRNKKKEIREWTKNKELFIERYKKSTNTANATVDDNSNVSSKNIGVMNAEIHKEDNIQVNRRLVTDKLKEIYPDFNYKQYIKDLKTKILYKHDESSICATGPYCCSITMYPFLLHGLEKIGGLSAKPKNLDSFCGMYVNLIFAVSALFLGAVATSEFLVYFDYFAKKEFGDDYYLHPNEFVNLGPKYRDLLRKSHYYCSTVDELKNHDFGSDELNRLRDEILYDSERELTEEELKKYEEELAKYNDNNNIVNFTSPIKIGDGTRTIGSVIQQYFQQVV